MQVFGCGIVIGALHAMSSARHAGLHSYMSISRERKGEYLAVGWTLHCVFGPDGRGPVCFERGTVQRDARCRMAGHYRWRRQAKGLRMRSWVSS